MNRIESGFTRGEADPLLFSAMVDGAMFTQVQKVLDARKEKGFIRDFFSLWADFQNTLSVIRAQNLHWSLNQLKAVLLDAGSIEKSIFEDSLSTPPEQLGARLSQGAHGLALEQAISEFAQTNDIGAITKRMQEGLMHIIQDARWQAHSLGPIVGYLLAREAEAEALRLIFGALEGGFEPQLPEMYA